MSMAMQAEIKAFPGGRIAPGVPYDRSLIASVRRIRGLSRHPEQKPWSRTDTRETLDALPSGLKDAIRSHQLKQPSMDKTMPVVLSINPIDTVDEVV